MGRAVLLQIANDPHAENGHRVSAARALLDAGLDPQGDAATGLEHLTNRELADLVLALPEA